MTDHVQIEFITQVNTLLLYVSQPLDLLLQLTYSVLYIYRLSIR